MSKRIVSLFLALMLVFGMSAALAEETSVTVTDVKGREITLTKPATRIVALTPADCEILCALGCEEALVGCGAYCNYPESILNLPVVQSGADTNIEEIFALEPQVLLMTDMAALDDMVGVLEANGVKVVISDAGNIAETYDTIRMIGALMGKDEEAEAIVLDMQTAFEEIAAQSVNVDKSVYFEVSPLEYGLWTAGMNSFMDELANMCGLTNIFADMDGWGAVSEEQVLMRNPDFIVTTTMYYGQGLLPDEEIMSRAGWESVNAVKNGDVINVDSDIFSRPGPRLKDAAIELFNFVNGIEPEAAAEQAE